MWTARTVAAAGICAALILMFNSGGQSFAQAVKAIDNARTITWTSTAYSRAHSSDGKRTWITTKRITHAYRAPGLYRTTHYDGGGNTRLVEITDTKSNNTLQLDMKTKKAVSTWRASTQFDPRGGGPFDELSEILKHKPLELVGQRKVDGQAVNVFRFAPGSRNRSRDLWLDADSKRLVGISDPGADLFDPATLPDRGNPAEKGISKGEMLGLVQGEIVFDAQLEADLFSMTPPAGFQLTEDAPRPTVTEAEMIEFLGATARYNDGVFVDTPRGLELEHYNKAAGKAKADRTELEQKLVDLTYKHMLDRNSYPIWDFAEAYTAPGTFRYLGKGVKLGSAERIVCWYKLKSTGSYRAVYGDLSVKDVTPKDLPLPVDE